MAQSFHLFWNSWNGGILLAAALSSIALFSIFLRMRISAYRSKRGSLSFSPLKNRLLSLASNALFQRRVLRSPLPGLVHAVLFWSFLATLFLHLLKMLPLFTGIEVEGGFGAGLFSASRIAGIAGLLAFFLLAFRRFILRPHRLRGTTRNPEIHAALLLIFATGLLTAKLRSDLFGSPEPLQPQGLIFLHRLAWSLHFALALFLLAWLPRTRLFHVLSGPANIFFRTSRPKGALETISLSGGPGSFGAAEISDFSKKSLLDLAACTGCGRCQAACPPYLAGKPLSPRNILLHLDERARETPWPGSAEKNRKGRPFSLLGEPLSRAALWACTTCGACMEACPVLVDPLEKVVSVRRNRVLCAGDYPSPLKEIFENLELWGTPWGPVRRDAWPENLEPPPLPSGKDGEILLFAGCQGAFRERIGKAVLSLVRVLRRAEVPFAMLGKNEACCGSMARRIGNEYLFQKIARDNIEQFNSCGVKRILTLCPHCYHTIRFEYPELGGFFEVRHHADFLSALVEEKKLVPRKILQDGCTYKDPCYLGRLGSLYESPRRLLDAVAGKGREEFVRRRREALCCGAGGGVLWMQEETARKIARMRLSEMKTMRTRTLATSCPFCLEVLTAVSGGGSGEEPDPSSISQTLRIADVSELLEEAL